MSIKSAALAVAVAAASAMFLASPAHADDPQPAPNNPDVVIGYDDDNEVFPPKRPTADDPSLVCSPRGSHSYYVDTVSNSHKAVGPAQSNHNGTSSNASMTFSATASGTVTLSSNATISVQAGRLIAGGEVAAGVNLSASLTASLGNSVTVTAPPHTTINATYGVWRKKTIGTYTICRIASEQVTAWTPWKVGWYISEV